MFKPESTLLFSNARTVLNDGLRAIAGGQTEFDLGTVAAVDSSAVATLLAWQRAAVAAGNPLHLRNIPPTLTSLIELYGVSELLPRH